MAKQRPMRATPAYDRRDAARLLLASGLGLLAGLPLDLRAAKISLAANAGLPLDEGARGLMKRTVSGRVVA